MTAVNRYTFKRAASSEELTQIHRLNHQIFVDEVGQHEATGTRLLVDQFDDKNQYFIAKRDDLLVGMISVHDKPPFSVAHKLADPRILEDLGSQLLEVRLLAIHPDERNTRVLAGLLYAVFSYARNGGYSHLVISGVEKQLPMYERLGFQAIGPAVSRGKAEFTPMAVRIKDFPAKTVNRFQRWALGSSRVCLLPGPVHVSAGVQSAFAGPSESHRSCQFVAEFEDVRARLRQLAGGMGVALFPGSGTLANDVVGAAIAADRTKHAGLILANGEFGRRLLRHATRWRLHHHALDFEWGTPWDLTAVAECLASKPSIDWIWAVQLETSTGMSNDIGGLLRLAREHGIDVYLDCTSGFGAAELDLRSVTLATTVSGKSIGGYAGAAIVFADEKVIERFTPDAFPVSLDLPAALLSTGPLTTFSSQVIKALRQAVMEQGPQKWEQYRELGNFVRQNLQATRLTPLVSGPQAAPVVTSFQPRNGTSAAATIKRCAAAGFTIGGESGYLLERNWLQIATMGDVSIEDLPPLFEAL
jgi:aspartate aminotransferase-like enzyme/GNAT superfamily N-acetyltransferase